jgi:FMN-dependent oxidoreductase (nitrilotriacetate monooxygenase family)
MSREIHLAAFVEAGNLAHSLATWRHPRTDPRFLHPDYYRELGRTLERGRFDLMFFGDTLAISGADDGGASFRAVVRNGGQGAVGLDPRMVAQVVADATTRLGVACTASTTYAAPYELARAFSTLDFLSEGRIGWNVVTSLSAGEAKNFGFEEHLEHDARYERAEEFVEVVHALWGSWDEDALVHDKASGVFADPTRVHPIDHRGEHFRVRGPAQLPQSPQKRPVLLQAGSSPRGRDFAARWAEVIFEVDSTSEGRRAFYADIRERAALAQRDPDQVKILPAFQPFVGETEAIARAKQEFHNSLADPAAGVVTLSTLSGHDFTAYPMDEPVADIEVPGTRGLFAMMQQRSEKEDLTLADVGRLFAQSQLIPQLVGTAEQIADELEAMVDGGEADGFMLTAGETPGGFDDFVDFVVPELQRRGSYRTDYAGTTLRDHLGLAEASLTPAPRVSR